MANQLLNAFRDTKNMTKSYISAANALSRVKIPRKEFDGSKADEPNVQLKRGRSMSSKDKNQERKKLKMRKKIFKKK